MNLKKKKFDCVEMKRKGAEQIYQITKDMTLEEELEYWRKKTEELNLRIKKWNATHDRRKTRLKITPAKANRQSRLVGVG